MKKIVGGRKYDTETAKLLGADGYSSRNDFNFWRQELYLKKTGEFFLYGEGGPRSQYGRTVGQNCWEGGEDIEPLTEEEAKNWAEKHLDADNYESIFGEVEE